MQHETPNHFQTYAAIVAALPDDVGEWHWPVLTVIRTRARNGILSPEALRARASRAAKKKKLSRVYRVRLTRIALDRIVTQLEATRPDVRDGTIYPKQFDILVEATIAEIVEEALRPNKPNASRK